MYLFTYIISTICLIYSKKYSGIKRKILECYFVLIPSILAGLRDFSVGVDVLVYGNEWFYRACRYTSLFKYLHDANAYSVNYGYAFLNYIVSRFTNNPHWFYFFLELLDMIILLGIMKSNQNKIDVVLCYTLFFFFYFNESMNMMRQTPALLIVAYSSVFIENKKPFRFILCILLAMCFHTTAFAAFLLYPLSLLTESRNRKIYNALLYALAVFFVVAFGNILDLLGVLGIVNPERYSVYLSASDAVGGRYVRILFFGLLFTLFSLVKRKLWKNSTYVKTLYMYCSFSFILSFMMLLYSTSYIIRISYYFDIFLLIYMPMVSDYLPVTAGQQKKGCRKAIIAGMFIMYWLFVFVIRGGGNTIPYKFMHF